MGCFFVNEITTDFTLGGGEKYFDGITKPFFIEK